jgi:hypothetical protein
MVRRDLGQDVADRPHFYSQFWVDVSSGRRDVSSASEDTLTEEPEDLAQDFAEAAPVAPAKPKAPRSEPKKPEQRPTITSLADLANIDLLMKNSAEMESDEVPDLETGPMDDLESLQTADTGTTVEADTEVGDEEFENAPEVAEAEGEDLDEFAFEDEEEDEWGSAHRPSKPSKSRRRERDRRGNF